MRCEACTDTTGHALLHDRLGHGRQVERVGHVVIIEGYNRDVVQDSPGQL